MSFRKFEPYNCGRRPERNQEVHPINAHKVSPLSYVHCFQTLIKSIVVRIPWHDMSNGGEQSEDQEKDAAAEEGDSDEEDDDNNNDEVDPDRPKKRTSSSSSNGVHLKGDDDQDFGEGEGLDGKGNRCDLLWSGALARRLFTGFKFTESRNGAAAKKLLDGKGAGHFWELAQRIDSIKEAAKIL